MNEDDFDDEYNDDEPCDHMDADTDILTGLQTCFCGWRKWLTDAELRAEIKFQAQAYEDFHEATAQDDGEGA